MSAVARVLALIVVLFSLSGATFQGYWQQINANDFGVRGDGSTDDTAAIQAAIDAAYAANIETIYLPHPSVCYKTTASLYLDAPGNLRSSLSTPTIFSFSLSLVGDPGGGTHEGNYGTRICPNSGFPALYVGPGQGMRVSHITLRGGGGLSATQYRCGRTPGSPPSSGIYIAGGSAGASRTKIEDVMIENFYYGIAVGLNNGALGDSNSFEKIYINNTCNGIFLGASQNYINDCIECNVNGTTNALNTTQGVGMTVVGGNWSATSGLAVGVMTLSGWSAITATANGSNFDYTFDATLSAPAYSGVTSYVYGDVVSSGGQVWFCINFSPACTGTTPTGAVPSTWETIDKYIPKIFNAFAIVTTHYGVIPMTVTAFTQATGAISFKIWRPWSYYYFQQFNAVANGDLQVEVQTGTTLYAAEWGTTFVGGGINAKGVHIENPTMPDQLFSSTTSLNGAAPNVFEDIRLNNNPAEVGSIGGTPKQQAQFYVSQSFPIINVGNVGMDIRSSALNINGSNPGMVDVDVSQQSTTNDNTFRVRDTNFQYYPLAMRPFGALGFNNTQSYPSVSSPGLGSGIFDQAAFTPKQHASGSDGSWWRRTWGRSTHWGWRPAPMEHPCITGSQLTTLAGALPAWTNSSGNITFGYPFLYGGQIYSVCDWYLGTQTHYLFESTHHFYSLGQNITTTNVPTLSWSYKGQGAFVYADAVTLSVMFPGLGVILNDGSSDIQYIVTGVWPTLGYFSVCVATARTEASCLALRLRSLPAP